MGRKIRLLGYRIDNRIYFSLETKTIISLDGGEKNFPLRITKARLLEYLLQRAGAGNISDNELLENVWDKYGLSSSSQRLWLVIRELKILFNKLNISDDFIVRMERNGYIVDGAYVSEIFEFYKETDTDEMMAIEV